jgi:hypothetical protein
MFRLIIWPSSGLTRTFEQTTDHYTGCWCHLHYIMCKYVLKCRLNVCTHPTPGTTTSLSTGRRTQTFQCSPLTTLPNTDGRSLRTQRGYTYYGFIVIFSVLNTIYNFFPVPPHVPYGLRGLPSWLWPMCNFEVGTPMRRSYVVPVRWIVIYGYEVPGGALNISYTKLPRPWSPWESSPSKKNSHGRTGNRTRDHMISSQTLTARPRGWSQFTTSNLYFNTYLHITQCKCHQQPV